MAGRIMTAQTSTQRDAGSPPTLFGSRRSICHRGLHEASKQHHHVEPVLVRRARRRRIRSTSAWPAGRLWCASSRSAGRVRTAATWWWIRSTTSWPAGWIRSTTSWSAGWIWSASSGPAGWIRRWWRTAVVVRSASGAGIRPTSGVQLEHGTSSGCGSAAVAVVHCGGSRP